MDWIRTRPTVNINYSFIQCKFFVMNFWPEKLINAFLYRYRFLEVRDCRIPLSFGPPPQSLTKRQIINRSDCYLLNNCRLLLLENVKNIIIQLIFLRGIFIYNFSMYVIQHCFTCRPSDSTMSEDAGIESMTVATMALTARRSNHSATSTFYSVYVWFGGTYNKSEMSAGRRQLILATVWEC
jgi:hypothetical protein